MEDHLSHPEPRIYVAGHRGLVGSALVRLLRARGHAGIVTRTHDRAGIKLCESYNRQYGTDFRSVMPTNLYGPGDNYHPQDSHVIPALVRRFHEAKTEGASEVVIWGSGRPMREFMYVDDMAVASVHVMNLGREAYAASTGPMHSHINVGTGTEVSIHDLAHLVREVVGFDGRIVFDARKPDGTPRKLLDVSKLRALGWQASTPLREGLHRAYAAFLAARLADVAA